jgi:hypothetical protein
MTGGSGGAGGDETNVFNTNFGGDSSMAGVSKQATTGNLYGGGGGGSIAGDFAGSAGANGVIFFEW